MPSENKNGNSRETNVTENAFFAKLSVLSNNGERIEEQVKQICTRSRVLSKSIEGNGLWLNRLWRDLRYKGSIFFFT